MRRQGTNRMETIGPDADLALGYLTDLKSGSSWLGLSSDIDDQRILQSDWMRDITE